MSAPASLSRLRPPAASGREGRAGGGGLGSAGGDGAQRGVALGRPGPLAGGSIRFEGGGTARPAPRAARDALSGARARAPPRRPPSHHPQSACGLGGRSASVREEKVAGPKCEIGIWGVLVPCGGPPRTPPLPPSPPPQEGRGWAKEGVFS